MRGSGGGSTWLARPCSVVNVDGLQDDTSEQARERLLVMGEIAAEVAHELRNVLQLITANTYLARQDPAASGPVLLKIERSARLAHAIVDDLMSLARGEPARAEPTLLAEIVVAARAEIAPEAAVWQDSLSPVDIRVRAHPGLAGRLLHALYENAISASLPRAPTIVTRGRIEGDAVLVEIADDGPGVPKDIATRIFDPLVTGRSGGTGLGLALARRIAAAHGGSIALVDSPDRTEGACFQIRIPLGA
jgi:signal transduction histidine kinase